jgi:acyl carrier protein
MEDKLRSIFSEALGIEPAIVTNELTYASIPEWDSVAHMVLISAIEEGFEIMIDTEDVIDMSSFLKAQDIVKKYL